MLTRPPSHTWGLRYHKNLQLAQGILIKKKKIFLFLSFVAVCSPRPSNDPKANPSSPFQAADKHIFTIFQNQQGFVICLTLWPEKSKSKQGLFLSLTPKHDLSLVTAPKPA